MAYQSRDFFHFWNTPYYNLILAIAMRTYKFINILAEYKVANLTSSFNTFKLLTCQSIPKSNSFILSSSSRNKQTMLVWRPSECFYGCIVVIKPY